jgi:hypothetical protein
MEVAFVAGHYDSDPTSTRLSDITAAWSIGVAHLPPEGQRRVIDYARSLPQDFHFARAVRAADVALKTAHPGVGCELRSLPGEGTLMGELTQDMGERLRGQKGLDRQNVRPRDPKGPV